MGNVEIIECHDVQRWSRYLELCDHYDFYHLAAYHALQEQSDKNRGVLVAYQERNCCVAIPLFIRPISSVAGINGELIDYYDATSVYGYPGPITNHDWNDRDFFERFGHALFEVLCDQKVITAFSRLHPLLDNSRALTVGEVVALGQTVSIDLTLPIDQQYRKYRENHRRDLKAAQRVGIVGYHDKNWIYFEDFLRLYEVTMQKVNATLVYFFDRAYFDGLRRSLGDMLQFFVVKQGDRVLSAGLFTHIDGIVQYHLGGSDPKYASHAASKVLMDTVRLWSNEQGAYVFHLGGGVGAQNDSLFLFKTGFSDRRHNFQIWKYIVDVERYELAIFQREQWLKSENLTTVGDYFPQYRAIAYEA
ncbi:MAG: hypothetical protein BroJett018_27680 [Chloroflexota bacterium]|nr:GNAT family N-acetyltransferase [Chloroflexota bacterium]NOG63792.1 GNAT family N-acetyltransferase [Chloroflexota bacterium]GIK64974.1 MAG: hypothetical protein BroJett018_27680 [Chloroflexota bacterium]